MSSLLGSNTGWAVVAILAIPAVILIAAEVDERLRQRRSPLRSAVSILRNWTLPCLAAWTILGAVIGLDDGAFPVQLAASGAVISLAAAVLRSIRIVIAGLRDRRRADRKQAPPQLLLAMPRLLTILVVGWILLSGVWGVDLSGLLTALGVGSLVVSFALQDTLSGLASGLLLIGDRPFEPGDWIRTGDREGLVVDINWRSSRIQDRNGDTIVIPNAELAGGSIVNFSAPDRLHRVVVPLQVAYVNPPTLAKAMLLDAAAGTRGVLSDPPPTVRVVQIDDPLMGYEVQMWVDDYAIAPRVASDFGSLVWYQSHRHEVPLPSPAQDLYMYDGVAAGEADRLSTGELFRLMRDVPLLASLPDDELDRLAHSARASRYSVGEIVASSDHPSHDLVVIVEGRAEMALSLLDGRHAVITELGPLDTVGLIEGLDEGTVALRAMDDCEVVIVDAAAAGEMGSRHTNVAAALNRMAEIRRRRVERILERRLLTGTSAGNGHPDG